MPPPTPAAPYAKKLTFIESLDFASKVTGALLAGGFAALTFPLYGNRAAKTYRAHIIHAFLRTLSCSLTVRQIQISTTTASYEKYAKSRGITPETVSWGETGRGHWIGSSGASKILVWFHGGGYYAPAHPAYFEFLRSVVDDVCQSGQDFSVLVPSYTLAPEAKYPSQLREGLDVLRYLVEKEGKLFRNIVIGGDSAGGNLVLGILSHLLHPHPDLPDGPIVSEPLSGALMLSPWVSCDPTWLSVERNKNKDSNTLVTTAISAKYFLAEKSWDNYNEPMRATPEWWTGVKARDLLVISGGDEIMTDAHQAFARKLKISNPDNTRVIVAAGEGHVAPVLDLMLGDHSDFESSRAIKEWLSSTL